MEGLTHFLDFMGKSPLLAAALIILYVSFRGARRARKFIYADGLIAGLRDDLSKRFDKIQAATEKTHDALKTRPKCAEFCEFSEEFQSLIKCIHDLEANAHLTRKKIIELQNEETSGRHDLMEALKEQIEAMDDFIFALGQRKKAKPGET